jgi:predicted kinase
MERVGRCRRCIWAIAAELGRNGGNVVLDLGLMKAQDRAEWLARARDAGLVAQLHYITAPLAERRTRVLVRNGGVDGSRAFEVTPAMFDFMEARFEPATAEELATARVLHT